MKRRQALVSPGLARHIANHIAKHVWDGQELRQVHPGVFAHPDGRVLAVMSAAPISEPAVNALRMSGLLWELVALMDINHQHLIYGPRHKLGEDEWVDVVSSCLAATQDVQRVCTRFEVMVAADPSKLACLGEASAIVAAQQLDGMPAAEDRRRVIVEAGWEFLDHLESEVTRAVEAAA